MPNADQNIQQFEGVKHSLEDLVRKYVSSVMFVFDKRIQKDLIFLCQEITEGMVSGCVFQNGRWDEHRILMEDCFILREFPTVGLVQIGETIYLLTKTSQRQWRRGANDHTMTYNRIYPREDGLRGKPSNLIYAQAFQQKYMSREDFDKHVREGDIRKPQVITNKFWMVSTDNHLISLFYEEVFVGMFDRKKQFISCAESYTLVEEAVHEWGLLVS